VRASKREGYDNKQEENKIAPCRLLLDDEKREKYSRKNFEVHVLHDTLKKQKCKEVGNVREWG